MRVHAFNRSALTLISTGAILLSSFVPANAAVPSKEELLNSSNAETFRSIENTSDAEFYGTNDQELIDALNEISEGFETYGSNGAYDDLPMESGVTFYSWDSFANCVGEGLAKSFGVDALKRAFNDEVRAALKSRQWKVASAIMHKNLEKIVGKKMASKIIKKIAGKALPGGLPGQIAWQTGKCGIKEAW